MRRHGFVFLAVFAAVGCSGRDSARDAGDLTRSLVRIDLSYTRVGGAEARFDAQAHFVRYRSFDPAGVPTILGFADFDSMPLDACRVSDGTAELDEALSADGTAHGVPAEVALLDAGRLEVRGPVDRAQLSTHHYPELLAFVSGVVYGADEARPVTLGLGQPYQVAGDGGEEVGPFIASAVAPRAFPSLSPSGEPLRRGADLELRWAEADGLAAAPSPSVEPLLVEIKWSGRLGARAVRCRVRDDGSFTVPRDAFDALPPPSLLNGATVSATRIGRSPLAAPGVGRGELTVELRDVVPLVVGP
jgi:hypothetical protein